MSHDHHAHSHAPHSMNTAFAIAVLCNFIFADLQLGYAFYANSVSLMADAVHNLADVLGLALAWAASWLSTRKPALNKYSYGYKKTTILSAALNSCLLMASSLCIIGLAIHKLFHLTEINTPVVIILASAGILVNCGTALLFMKEAHHDLNIKGAFLHLLNDALISLGVVIAAVIIHFTHTLWLDPALSLMIVGIILKGAWSLLTDSVRLILDAVPRHIDHTAVEQFLLKQPHVTSVHDVHIWGLSTKEVALTAHLVGPKQILSDAEYHHINTALKSQFNIDHATLQIEYQHDGYPCHQGEKC